MRSFFVLTGTTYWATHLSIYQHLRASNLVIDSTGLLVGWTLFSFQTPQTTLRAFPPGAFSDGNYLYEPQLFI